MSDNTTRTKRAEIRMRKKVVADILDSVPDYIQKVQCDTTLGTQPFKCAVLSCRNIFEKYNPSGRQKFHNFPQDPHLKAMWLAKCRVKENFNTDVAKVCTDHFIPDNYERNFKEELTNPRFKRQLKPDAIPTQLLEGVEVSIVDFINTDDDIPNMVDIKNAVDENMLLKDKLEKLTEEKEALLAQHTEYTKKLNFKKRKCYSIKTQYRKLTEKSNLAKEHKSLLTRVFSQSQINVLLGKRKVVWSNDDMAMAFTLRHMSNKECYLYLKNAVNIPLPSLSCIQKWAASK